ncbi:hypothetical protein [Magnetococcus sp. PR-3]|uniref:hypothetical protein n=1 Tax=Magnetococcus sp. PR-3 TaxID=3120355 RepID=UPI002FCE47B6
MTNQKYVYLWALLGMATGVQPTMLLADIYTCKERSGITTLRNSACPDGQVQIDHMFTSPAVLTPPSPEPDQGKPAPLEASGMAPQLPPQPTGQMLQPTKGMGAQILQNPRYFQSLMRLGANPEVQKLLKNAQFVKAIQNNTEQVLMGHYEYRVLAKTYPNLRAKLLQLIAGQ